MLIFNRAIWPAPFPGDETPYPHTFLASVTFSKAPYHLNKRHDPWVIPLSKIGRNLLKTASFCLWADMRRGGVPFAGGIRVFLDGVFWQNTACTGVDFAGGVRASCEVRKVGIFGMRPCLG